MRRNPTRQARGLGLLLVSALATAACGSTLQTGDDTVLSGGQPVPAERGAAVCRDTTAGQRRGARVLDRGAAGGGGQR